MKKTFLKLIVTLMLVCALTASVPMVFATEVEIAGGKETVTFTNDQDKFNYYTEFDQYPYVVDGKLYGWSLAEQKAIYKQGSYEDVDVEVDVGTINKGGKFDAGIIVQASNVGNAMGVLTGWYVGLENGTGTTFIKLHRWENSVWKGVKYEKAGVILQQVNHLRVAVKSGVLYAYLNYSEVEEFSYNIGTASGQVGLRCFYSPNYFDNFSVTGSSISLNTAEITAYMNQANQIDTALLTDVSRGDLTTALQACVTAKDGTSQNAIDEACANLRKVLSELNYTHTYAELQTLIATAQALTNNGTYTANSFNSLTAVLERCVALTDSSSENDISYWYKRLQLRIDSLIAYVK